jgi:hypothetical protein
MSELLGLLDKSEEKLSLIKKNIETNNFDVNNDDNIMRVLKELLIRESTTNGLSDLRPLLWELQSIEREYQHNNQSDDEEEFDYAPSYKRKQLLKLLQKLFIVVQNLKRKHNILDRKKKSIKPKTKRKVCRCKK